MCNKSEYFAPRIKEFGYSLESQIIDNEPLSQTITARCSDGHEIFRTLQDFNRSPETFCLTCHENKPDSILTFCRDKKRAESNAYIYFVLLKDIQGSLAKKIGITCKSPVSKRFSADIFERELIKSNSLANLTRAEAFCVESSLLRATKDYQYIGDFLDTENSGRNFEGYTELRRTSLDDSYVINQIEEDIKKVKQIGWIQFAKSNLKLTRKEREVVEKYLQSF